MSGVMQAWNRYFFAATPATTLGLFRIFYGLIVFVAVLGIFPYRDTFLGPDAIVAPEVMHRMDSHRWELLGFRLMPVGDPGMAIFLIGLMTAALMLSLGLFSRVASVAVFLGVY